MIEDHILCTPSITNAHTNRLISKFTQIKVVFLYWLPCILRMSRPHRTSIYDHPHPSRPSSVATDRKPLHLQDVELKDRSSKSLLANVLDIDDDFRHNHRGAGGTPAQLPTAAFFRTVYRYVLTFNIKYNSQIKSTLSPTHKSSQ